MAISFHLNVLSPEEVAHYIDHRCRVAGANKWLFTEEAIDLIGKSSDGVPRKINTYCELALMQGMFDKKDIIDRKTTEEAVEDINT
jgi:type II secretory pathway predicted ATPase ExeA